MIRPLPDPPGAAGTRLLPVLPLLPGQPPIAFLVDYDGTIARTDVSDSLLARFVTADWEAHVAEYDAGLTGSATVLSTCRSI